MRSKFWPNFGKCCHVPQVRQTPVPARVWRANVRWVHPPATAYNALIASLSPNAENQALLLIQKLYSFSEEVLCLARPEGMRRHETMQQARPAEHDYKGRKLLF